MPNENTPLIAVVRVQPRRQRYPHSGLRRFCTCLLATLLVLSLSSILLTLLLVPECDHNNRSDSRHGFRPCIPKHPLYRDGDHMHWDDDWWLTSKTADLIGYDELVDILMTTPNEAKAREWSQYYTSGPHLAGKNFSQAKWTQDRWDEFGLPQTEIVAYDVYLNYPVDHRLALLEDKSNKTGLSQRSPNWKVKYEASLEEDVLKEDGTSGLKDRVQTFHGYSASGNVTAPYVFVNYGTYQDYEDLLAHNISLKGKIALAKYGSIFRGLKIKRAQELGMVGVVIYSDPGDDGDVTDENGNKTYPSGPARNPSSVQRGSAQFLCEYIDPF
jgi:N-acetylated-alpha-linked acidic dipeptidase